jgi:predicted enzyme related to lactoylglutathione lyase
MQNNKHAINWFEIPVRNLSKSASFYGAVIGRPLSQEVFGGIPHAMFATTGPEAITGALVEDPKREPGNRGVTIYLDVTAVQPAVERALAAGGKIVQPFTDIGPHGTIALIADRDGNVVGLHAPKAEVAS